MCTSVKQRPLALIRSRTSFVFGLGTGISRTSHFALAAGAIALGAMNHYRHVPSLESGKVDASRLLRAVRAEVVVLAVVLLLSALLGSLPMPHATAP